MSNPKSNTQTRKFIIPGEYKKGSIIVDEPKDEAIPGDKPGTMSGRRMNIAHNRNGREPLILATPGLCFSSKGIIENEKSKKLQIGFNIFDSQNKNDEADLKNRKQYLQDFNDITDDAISAMEPYRKRLGEAADFPEYIRTVRKPKFNKMYYPKDAETGQLNTSVAILYVPFRLKNVNITEDHEGNPINPPIKGQQIVGTFKDENDKRIRMDPYAPGFLTEDSPLYHYMDRPLNVFGLVQFESIYKGAMGYSLMFKVIEAVFYKTEILSKMGSISELKNMGLLKEAKSILPLNDEEDESEEVVPVKSAQSSSKNDSMPAIKNMKIGDEEIKDDEEVVAPKKKKEKKVEVEEEEVVQKPRTKRRVKKE